MLSSGRNFKLYNPFQILTDTQDIQRIVSSFRIGREQWINFNPQESTLKISLEYWQTSDRSRLCSSLVNDNASLIERTFTGAGSLEAWIRKATFLSCADDALLKAIDIIVGKARIHEFMAEQLNYLHTEHMVRFGGEGILYWHLDTEAFVSTLPVHGVSGKFSLRRPKEIFGSRVGEVIEIKRESEYDAFDLDQGLISFFPGTAYCPSRAIPHRGIKTSEPSDRLVCISYSW